LRGAENQAADALSRIDAISAINTVPATELAEKQSTDPELFSYLSKSQSTALRLKKISIEDCEIYCDISKTGYQRPFVPQTLRKRIFDQYHNLAHPGAKRTRALISSRYVWPNLNKDVGEWTRSCLICQQAKFSRHISASLSQFPSNIDRLDHVHLDIIGELPISNGMRYCLTMIDRATRWFEVIPIANITAQTVADAFICNWVARFGCPSKVATDQGRQFESELFHKLSQALGSKRVRTTTYHPQCNGLIENLHRTLKTAITSYSDPAHWTDYLPIILLSLRASINTQTNTSPAEALIGQELRLPGDIFAPNPPKDKNAISHRIFEATKAIRNLQHHDTQRRSYVPQTISSCTHVFLRDDRIKPSFTYPYRGPFKVLERGDKYFSIEIRGKPKTWQAENRYYRSSKTVLHIC